MDSLIPFFLLCQVTTWVNYAKNVAMLLGFCLHHHQSLL